ncbi:Phosphoserine phosphatase [Brevibacterium siliguriense]|uniref:Phosphoserine phosphatase n=1 Tax=Brevibacterium siliguriense TaxID=1136497 RepID=A0A1H1WA35_9MICO|nr:HAD family hydrolase [Brevibacterium siliguriense]SDS93963.1 Phosphoserine phosphatase [Brevibacterium siliguriense]
MSLNLQLVSWEESVAKHSIEEFVASAVDGPEAVPLPERIAVFDNDGTLWSEKPMPTQLHYVVQQWQDAIKADPSLAKRQPYRAVKDGDLAWLGRAIDKHYDGNDSDLELLVKAIVGLVEHNSVEDYARSVEEFYRTAQHPSLKRPYAETVYQPMVELLRYLEAHGFTCYIVSGGERDFMRSITEEYYGIPPERVIGSAYGLTYDWESSSLRYAASLSFFDDGEEKPKRIWSRIGRRPLLAVGNSNGDVPMLDFTKFGPRRGLSLLIHHDDDTNRGDPPYDAGAQSALAAAADRPYIRVSVKNDWTTLFPFTVQQRRDQ